MCAGGQFTDVFGAFVHCFQKRTEPLRKCGVAGAATKSTGFFEVGLGEPADGTARGCGAFLDFLGRADTKQQIGQSETGRILYSLFLRASFAKVHLLHFAVEDLGQENCRIIAFANVAQHLGNLDHDEG